MIRNMYNINMIRYDDKIWNSFTYREQEILYVPESNNISLHSIGSVRKMDDLRK